VELPGPPAPLPPRFTPAICTCIIWKKAKGSCRLRIFTSCLAPPRTPPPVVRPKDPKSQFYVRIRPPKPKTRWKILRVRSIHSPARFCEYANSLWKILPVNARLLSKIPRIRVFTLEYSASYARLLSKILWLRSFTLQDSASTPQFTVQDSASTVIRSTRFRKYALRLQFQDSAKRLHSLWNILWVIIISVFFKELFVCGLSGP